MVIKAETLKVTCLLISVIIIVIMIGLTVMIVIVIVIRTVKAETLEEAHLLI